MAKKKDRSYDPAKELEELNALVDQAENQGLIPRDVPGEFYFCLEKPDGTLHEGYAKFKRGKTHLVAFGRRVHTSVLMKIANGESITPEEAAANPILLGAGKDRCAELLTKWIIIGANHFTFSEINTTTTNEE